MDAVSNGLISSGTGLSGIERKNELISLNSNMTRILLKKQLIKFWWQDVLAFRICKRVAGRAYAVRWKKFRSDHSTMWSGDSDDYY